MSVALARIASVTFVRSCLSKMCRLAQEERRLLSCGGVRVRSVSHSVATSRRRSVLLRRCLLDVMNRTLLMSILYISLARPSSSSFLRNWV